MGGWWGWTKWVVYYLVNVIVVVEVYREVIQTRFECVVFSILALIYFEQIAEFSGDTLYRSMARDHRNEIHGSLAERMDKPLPASVIDDIKNLSENTAKVNKYATRNLLAVYLLRLLILWNLLKAVFIGW